MKKSKESNHNIYWIKYEAFKEALCRVVGEGNDEAWLRWLDDLMKEHEKYITLA